MYKTDIDALEDQEAARVEDALSEQDAKDLLKAKKVIDRLHAEVAKGDIRSLRVVTKAAARLYEQAEYQVPQWSRGLRYAVATLAFATVGVLTGGSICGVIATIPPHLPPNSVPADAGPSDISNHSRIYPSHGPEPMGSVQEPADDSIDARFLNDTGMQPQKLNFNPSLASEGYRISFERDIRLVSLKKKDTVYKLKTNFPHTMTMPGFRTKVYR